MIAIPRHHLGKIYLSLLIVGICLFTIVAARLTHSAFAASQTPKSGQHILTVYDDGTQKGFLTSASTLGEALKEAKITLAKDDITEPGLDQKLVSSNYDVTIYRARPVLIIDGESRTKVITAYHTGKQIAAQAGITLHDEDSVDIESSPDVVADGAPERMVIKRATPFTLVLYGKTVASFTQSKTVQDMMKEKNIKLGTTDTLSVPEQAVITAGMTIEIWRNGAQTATVQEPVAFDTQRIQDANQPIGYKNVQTAGKDGAKMVTYQITVKNGVPVSKQVIQEVVTEQPITQVEVVGSKVTLPPGSHTDWMAAAGIAPGDYGYVEYIVNREGGWNPCKVQGGAVNCSYAADGGKMGYGIVQATPGIKMQSAGADWATNPITQLRWATGYAVGRYGSWAGAYNHWLSSHNW